MKGGGFQIKEKSQTHHLMHHHTLLEWNHGDYHDVYFKDVANRGHQLERRLAFVGKQCPLHLWSRLCACACAVRLPACTHTQTDSNAGQSSHVYFQHWVCGTEQGLSRSRGFRVFRAELSTATPLSHLSVSALSQVRVTVSVQTAVRGKCKKLSRSNSTDNKHRSRYTDVTSLTIRRWLKVPLKLK